MKGMHQILERSAYFKLAIHVGFIKGQLRGKPQFGNQFGIVKQDLDFRSATSQLIFAVFNSYHNGRPVPAAIKLAHDSPLERASMMLGAVRFCRFQPISSSNRSLARFVDLTWKIPASSSMRSFPKIPETAAARTNQG